MSHEWTAAEDAAFRAAIDSEHDNGNGPDVDVDVDVTASAGSWEPVDLAAIVAGVQAGAIVGPVPTLMSRTDGVSLLYCGELHQLAGEPESGKGLIALHEAVQRLDAGENVLYVDFEDAPASIVTRLLALGAIGEAIIEHFAYIRPVDPLDAARFYTLTRERAYALAVIDGVSEAYALLGLDLADNLDAAKFLTTLPRPIAETGAAVLLIDHVAKSKDSRGRYALGAQHKLAGVAAAYSTEVITAPSRQTAGLIKLRVEKDRHGHVRGHAQAGVVALVHVAPIDDGERIDVRIDPPEPTATDEAGNFRPTKLMERVSRFVEVEPGATLRTIRDSVEGKTTYVVQATRRLVAEGFVRQQADGQAQRHYSVREFRDDS